ncbi:glycerophosphodiester phosphodiesterase [Nannocystis pusilla]|uniref:glycerophosphodiester phosphodiesterase n=1 Tax=Nannocystis pusilla TaxID=889268 RepID=UPI003B7AA7C9
MMILAHRGASDTHLENTLPAFLHALERGADGVELDVQLSRDGEVVVFHDPELVRLAGRQQRIEHTTWDELAQVQLHRNQRIPGSPTCSTCGRPTAGSTSSSKPAARRWP